MNKINFITVFSVLFLTSVYSFPIRDDLDIEEFAPASSFSGTKMISPPKQTIKTPTSVTVANVVAMSPPNFKPKTEKPKTPKKLLIDEDKSFSEDVLEDGEFEDEYLEQSQKTESPPMPKAVRVYECLKSAPYYCHNALPEDIGPVKKKICVNAGCIIVRKVI